MVALCLMFSVTYYAQNYAGIIGWSLHRAHVAQLSYCDEATSLMYIMLKHMALVYCMTLHTLEYQL